MAIRPQRKVRRELPPARLFLDDIQEVIEIFRGAAKYRFLEPRDGPQEPKVSFRAGRFICDTLEDLRTLGGEATIFRVDFSEPDGYSAYLEVNQVNCEWRTWGLSEEGESVVYGKLRTLFESRLVVWKSFVQRLGAWSFFAPGFGLGFLGYMVARQAGKGLTGWDVLLLLASLALVGLTLYAAHFRHTVVVLNYAHEARSFRASAEKWLPYVVTALMGGLAAKVAEKLLRIFWP